MKRVVIASLLYHKFSTKVPGTYLFQANYRNLAIDRLSRLNGEWAKKKKGGGGVELTDFENCLQIIHYLFLITSHMSNGKNAPDN